MAKTTSEAWEEFDRADMRRDKEGMAEAANALVGLLERGQPVPDCLAERGLDRRGALYFLRMIRSVAEMA